MSGQNGTGNLRREQGDFQFQGAAGQRVKRFDDVRKNNLFLGIVPDRDVALRAVDIARDVSERHGLSRHIRPPDVMHVSLNAIGKYVAFPEDAVFAVSAAMAAVKAAPFEVNFDRVVHFTGSRAVVLCNPIRSEEMMDLHVQLAKEMWAAGLTFTFNRNFMPHMTLFYSDGALAEHMLAEPLCWVVREFVLIRSFIGESEYEYLGRWPLIG
ncbi:2'-5' RNA ligase family protein [Pararhizobium gei]|uniref:2'-5' RNA ligase family protein n=1 Tax=Pararhizobium gei TaxID=1395951 RepID=UPI0023DC7247|nr:2'-5' RNA ligase family protein [Rhizobium gei]